MKPLTSTVCFNVYQQTTTTILAPFQLTDCVRGMCVCVVYSRHTQTNVCIRANTHTHTKAFETINKCEMNDMEMNKKPFAWCRNVSVSVGVSD